MRGRFRPASLTAVTGRGGADRDRTDDPLLAKQVLSQAELQPPGLGRDLFPVT